MIGYIIQFQSLAINLYIFEYLPCIKIYKILLQIYMQGNQGGGIINYDQFRNRYNSSCQEWRSQPVMNRKVNDPACIVVFIIIFVAFIGIGSYYISIKDDPIVTSGGIIQLNNFKDGQELYISQFKGEIIACIFGSIFCSAIFILLLKIAPKIMVYTMIILSLSILAILTLVGIIIEAWGLAISMGITLLIYLIILACFRNKIKMGIVLVKVATNFMSQKPVVFLTPIVKVILTIGVAIFWVYSVSLMIQRANIKQDFNVDASQQKALTGVMVLFWLFFTFFFYYLMVFTIAVVCAFWYYDVKGQNSIVTAYRWIYKSAFGSIVFAALLIAIITFARMIVDGKRRENKNVAVAICLCIVSCLLKQIQALLKILNHNTIICMAATGQNYIDAAKSAIGLICTQFPLFSVARLISNLLVFWGLLFSVGIPTVLGYVWLNSQKDITDNQISSVMLIIIFSTIMISGMIFSILVQSVSCVFIFYSFDKRFKQLGYQSHNMPAEINQALGNANYQANSSYEQIKE